MTERIEAVTFDWYGTLAKHRHGAGRGRLFLQHLARHGLEAAAWDRQILYDVFNYYADAYQPESPAGESRVFWIEFTRRLFERSRVKGCPADQIESHAGAIRDIFGSACFELYPDVQPVLGALKKQGLLLAVISNWHRGLDFFCREMNLSNLLDTVISSSNFGIEKPDVRIFNEAVRSLRAEPGRVVHVGDSPDDDVAGAVAAGLKAILIDRENAHRSSGNRITSLYELVHISEVDSSLN
jgi:putative hydrolase of the HAD superfamily